MSRFLVDTQLLLWNVYGSRKLPARVVPLPATHADPFDRMLVAQAIVEPMALITSDVRLAAYPATIEVV